MTLVWCVIVCIYCVFIMPHTRLKLWVRICWSQFVYTLNFSLYFSLRSKKECIPGFICKIGLEVNIKLIQEDALSRIRVGL